jgi:hypothetical protein
MNLTAIIQAINGLKLQHHICDEDGWYSCPASGQCFNEYAGSECDCGADAHNARVDQIINDLISQQETQNNE